ncbi:MAG: putative lipase, partial [Fibromonadaceae bacterium]|nr:putative lipase [Fibromonadaceae bacterium]
MRICGTAFAFLFFVFFHGISNAGPDAVINQMKAEYKSEPQHNSAEQDFIGDIKDYDQDYYFYKGDYCVEANDFKITNMAMKLVYRFVTRSEAGTWLSQYDCQFHVVKIDYEIKCSNSLRYKGTEYLLSPSKIENNTVPGGGDRGKRMAGEEYGWIYNLDPSHYINADGSITWDANHNRAWSYSGGQPIAKFDTNSIIKKWSGQKIKNPPYTFTGTPGKLPRPVLFVHGLNSNYGEWGVETYGKGSVEYKEGKVKARGYKNGSLPNILARSNNLDDTTYDAINSNGIYFFQAEGGSLPNWEINALRSQSYALYKKIEAVMDDFYGRQNIKWQDSDKYQIDLVGHSQGGLTIREMLRGLRENLSSFPQGYSNAANHINRIITVNTPHLGSALAAPTGSDVLKNYGGLALFIDNLESKQKHELLNVHVELNNPALNTIASGATGLVGGFYDGYSLVYDNFNTDSPPSEDNAETDAMIKAIKYTGAIFMGILGAIPSMIYGTEANVAMKGPYMGPYDIDIILEQLWSDKTFSSVAKVDMLKEQRDTLESSRRNGGHLYEGSAFMKRLNGNPNNMYPLLPNGSKAILLPMYSDSAHKILQEAFYYISLDANRLCAQQKSAEGCFAINSVLSRLNEYVDSLSKGWVSASKVAFNDNLWKMLVDVQETWLKNSDGFVEASSQKFIMGNNSPENHKGYFLEPRPYAIHDALAPWEAVFHGKVFSNKGAAQQGLDLLCALSPACDNAFALARQSGRNAVLKLSEEVARGDFKERSLEVTGDIELVPIYEGEGIQGLSISANGETILTAQYEPGAGSSITLNYSNLQPASQAPQAMSTPLEQTELVLGPEIATQPYVIRKGDSLSISFMNYSGKAFRKDYFMPGLPSNLTVSVLAEKKLDMSPVIIGKAVAANPETQKISVPPPGHPLAPITLAVIHREARGEHEANTSRPRLLVYNATRDTLEFSKIAYYFTADPARMPKVVVDYPQIPVFVEHIGGDQWRFVLNAGSQKIPPRSFYPSADGWQIRVHYSDWYEYEHLNDWSADYSMGFAKFNSKIVIYDKDGKIIWGNESPLEEKEGDIIQKPEATLAWKDDAPWETNAFKPRVTVNNTGEVPLSNYRAQLWFRVPQGKNLSPLNIWYAPESSPSVKNAGGRVWVLDFHFNKHILYPGDSVSEGNIGL